MTCSVSTASPATTTKAFDSGVAPNVHTTCVAPRVSVVLTVSEICPWPDNTPQRTAAKPTALPLYFTRIGTNKLVPAAYVAESLISAVIV